MAYPHAMSASEEHPHPSDNSLARPRLPVLGIISMPASPSAPDFAHRLAGILAGLAALIARRFLRDPSALP